MTEYPRITYQCSGRAFDRLFKGKNFHDLSNRVCIELFVANEEQSLDETKNVVRKKLGLGHDAAVELVQLRDGKRVDLEDGVSIPQSFTRELTPALDDDFEAFKALTKTSLHATVTVIIRNNGHSSSTPVVCDRIPRRRTPLTM
jgi:hypothetical protein